MDHHFGIRCLHREDQVVVTVLPADRGKLECGFHHSEGRVAKPVHDAIGKRTMIGSNPHGNPTTLTTFDKWRKPLLNPIQLAVIIRIRVFSNCEPLTVGEVPRIDPHLLNMEGSLHCSGRIEVDIRDKRNRASLPPEPITDSADVSGIVHRRCRDPNNLTADRYESQRLSNGSFGIHGVGRGHRLHPDRIGQPNAHVANHYLAGHTPDKAQPRRHISGRQCASPCREFCNRQTGRSALDRHRRCPFSGSVTRLSGAGPGVGSQTETGRSKDLPELDLVPPAGFEPAIFTLKGWCPGPLDDGGSNTPANRVRCDPEPITVRHPETRIPIAAHMETARTCSDE